MDAVTQKEGQPKRLSFFLERANSFEDMPPGLHPNPNRSPAQRVRFGKEEQQNERALTFEKKSEQAI